MDENKARKKQSLTHLLKENGYVMPITEEDIVKYDERFGTTDIILPEEIDSPDFLLGTTPKPVTVKPSKSPKSQAKIVSLAKPTNVDYYRRTVLAAEIVNELHAEMAFGHLKLQKLIFLSLKVEKIDLPVNFLKQAMGPYDSQLMRSIDKQLELKKWFVFQPAEKLKYKALEHAGQHKSDFEKYYSLQQEKIHWLINTFRKVKSPTIEIVATLFACWEEILNEGQVVTDSVLLKKFYAWSAVKEKYTETEVLQQKEWMIEHSLIPV